MALPPLATTMDLPAKWQSDPLASKALLISSAAIREAAGSVIGRTTATIEVDGTESTLLRLPGPIVSVDSVTIDGTPVTDYKKIGEGLYRRRGWTLGHHLVPDYDQFSEVVITMTFGLGTIPDDIVELCARLGATWLADQAAGGISTAGVTAVKLDDASENYSDEAAGQISPIQIPELTRNWLAARFGGSAAPTVVQVIR